MKLTKLRFQDPSLYRLLPCCGIYYGEFYKNVTTHLLNTRERSLFLSILISLPPLFLSWWLVLRWTWAFRIWLRLNWGGDTFSFYLLRSVCDFLGQVWENLYWVLSSLEFGKISHRWVFGGHPVLDALGHVSKPVDNKIINFSSTSDQDGVMVAGFTILHEQLNSRQNTWKNDFKNITCQTTKNSDHWEMRKK